MLAGFVFSCYIFVRFSLRFMENFWGDVRKLPNIITLAHMIFGAPATIILYKNGFEYAWLVFFFFVMLDWLDGFIARRQKSVTSLGMFLDPLADQFLVLPILWYIGWGFNNYTLPVVLTIREVLMLLVRLLVKKDIPANIVGKLKVVAEYAGIAFILGGPWLGGLMILFLAVIVAYVSFFIYIWKVAETVYENNRA
ncbi:hypothetical protein A2662_01695 [Candidatus Giovannonibacteria bacterium RIFCSPHIGHO2_01_FULL_45_33]|nr:MAG: hypothetical protein A2662_01695 [Candidatus Giovannonibacteria bacterium RIFCSPHIGHO2_01_FULL_45_33]